MLTIRLIALLLRSARRLIVSEFEGIENDAYLDTVNYAYLDYVGVPAICDGYTHGVKLGDYKTDPQCAQLLQSAFKTTMAAVETAVKIPITEPVKAALMSFAANVGIPAFGSSTLLRMLNFADYAKAGDQMPTEYMPRA